VIDAELFKVVRPELLDGEQVSWAVRPDEHRYFCAADAYLIPFFGLLTAVGISALVVWLGDGDPLFAVWGIVWVLIGLYVAVGRLFVKRRRKRRTVYALTDRRALILSFHKGRTSTVALRLDLLPSFTCVRRAHGSGDIVFGSSSGLGRMLGNSALPAFVRASFPHSDVPAAFYDLADVETPNRLLMHSRPDL
jgi:hypothetical protein